MNKKPLNISEEAAVQMPMKTVASLIIIVALGTMGYFNMVERLNQHSTRLELMEKDPMEDAIFEFPIGNDEDDNLNGNADSNGEGDYDERLPEEETIRNQYEEVN